MHFLPIQKPGKNKLLISESPHNDFVASTLKKEDVHDSWSKTGWQLLTKGVLFEWSNFSISLSRPEDWERGERLAEDVPDPAVVDLVLDENLALSEEIL